MRYRTSSDIDISDAVRLEHTRQAPESLVLCNVEFGRGYEDLAWFYSSGGVLCIFMSLMNQVLTLVPKTEFDGHVYSLPQTPSGWIPSSAFQLPLMYTAQNKHRWQSCVLLLERHVIASRSQR